MRRNDMLMIVLSIMFGTALFMFWYHRGTTTHIHDERAYDSTSHSVIMCRTCDFVMRCDEWGCDTLRTGK